MTSFHYLSVPLHILTVDDNRKFVNWPMSSFSQFNSFVVYNSNYSAVSVI